MAAPTDPELLAHVMESMEIIEEAESEEELEQLKISTKKYIQENEQSIAHILASGDVEAKLDDLFTEAVHLRYHRNIL